MSMADTNMALLVVLLVSAVTALVGLSEKRQHALPSGVRRGMLFYFLAMGAWLIVAGGLAANGVITEARVPLVLIPSLLLTIGYAFSPAGLRLANGLCMHEIILLQAFRLPVELILLAYFFANRVPVSMTFEGRNFDVLTAVTAAVVAPLVAKGRVGAKGVWIWNIFGLLLLLNILGVAVLAIPENTLPFQWPSIWILFCVMIALASHLLIFRKLRRRDI